jgi:hypothetical protein
VESAARASEKGTRSGQIDQRAALEALETAQPALKITGNFQRKWPDLSPFVFAIQAE